MEQIEISTEKRIRTIERAREFRKAPTPTEAILWEALRKGRLEGRKFRKQHPIGIFIVDFYCPSEKLAVEIDGPVRDHQTERDAQRQCLIESAGVNFVRIPSEIIEQNLTKALERIKKSFTEKAPAPRVGKGLG